MKSIQLTRLSGDRFGYPAVRLLTPSLLLAGFVGLLGCTPPVDDRAESAASDLPPLLRIVTSFLPIQSHTAAVAGSGAIVEQLLDKESGPHDFQLTPGTVRKLADADLFIINGAGMEDWLDEIVSQSGNSELKVVDTSVGINLVGNPLEIEIAIEADGDSHGHHHGHAHCNHEGMNPHIWLDPVIAQQQVAVILRALQAADPERAEVFEANAAAYTEQLAALDAEFRARLDPLPNKNFVTFHEAFPYLAQRYGLNYVGAIAEFPERDPTPGELAALVDQIKQLEVGVLFAEQDYAPSLLQRVAAQTWARTSQLDTLEVGLGDADAYLTRMRANLDALTRAFAEESKP